MAVKSLKWNPKELEEKDGLTIFDGRAHQYYAWEFSVSISKSLIEAETEAAKKIKEITKILKGLKGDALEVAQDIGVAALCADGGLDKLISQMTLMVFPKRDVDRIQIAHT